MKKDFMLLTLAIAGLFIGNISQTKVDPYIKPSGGAPIGFGLSPQEQQLLNEAGAAIRSRLSSAWTNRPNSSELYQWVPSRQAIQQSAIQAGQDLEAIKAEENRILNEAGVGIRSKLSSAWANRPRTNRELYQMMRSRMPSRQQMQETLQPVAATAASYLPSAQQVQDFGWQQKSNLRDLRDDARTALREQASAAADRLPGMWEQARGYFSPNVTPIQQQTPVTSQSSGLLSRWFGSSKAQPSIPAQQITQPQREETIEDILWRSAEQQASPQTAPKSSRLAGGWFGGKVSPSELDSVTITEETTAVPSPKEIEAALEAAAIAGAQ